MNGSIDMTSAYPFWKGRLDWEYTDGYLSATMTTWMTDGTTAQGKDSDGNNFGASITIAGQTKKFYFQRQLANMVVGTFGASVSGTVIAVSGRVIPPYGSAMYPSSPQGESPLEGKEDVNLNPEPDVKPSVVSASPNPVQMGKNVAIVMERDRAGVKHYLSYSFGGQKGEIASNVDGSYAWTIPDMADLCSNATSGACTIYCSTYYEGKYIGDTRCVITLNVPAPTEVTSANGTMGTEMTITLSPKSGNFTHTLTCEMYESTVEIAIEAKGNVKWVPPYDLAREIPNLTYGTATIRCVTKNGTAVVGETSKTIRLTVPENDITRPTITAVTLRPVTNLTGDLAELYIRGRTGLEANIEASGTYSDISEYALNVGGAKASGQTATIKTLSTSGKVRVTVTVTDCRGFQNTWSSNVEVIAYEAPRVVPAKGYDHIVCDRALETGELNSGGTFLAVKARRQYSNMSQDGAARNSCILRYRYMEALSDSFGPWVTLLDADIAEDTVSVLISDVVSSTSKSYVVQLSAVDTVSGESNEHRIAFQISTNAISFVLADGVDGAGFGKYPEGPNMVDIAEHMVLVVRGKMRVLGEQWEKMGLHSGVSEAEEDLRVGKGCYFRVCNENHVYVSLNVTFQIGKYYQTINKETLPEAYRPKYNVYSLCQFNENGIALVCVNYVGWIVVKQIYPEAADGTTTVTSLDGYIDYFI